MSATSARPSSFYRRPLPEGAVALSSAAGRAAFRDALDAGTMESYFALSEQFHTQADPAFCGLGSLVVVLNALGIDPGRLWKGPWRWFDETLLDCCVSLDEVRTRGVTMRELACLAECNGARARPHFAARASATALREAIAISSRASAGPMLIAAYDRAALGQTGSGHFSPIAGYHPGNDWALILDVARFKYPPHWVAIEALFAAMQVVDVAAGTSRGWVELSAGRTPRPLLVALRAPTDGWRRALERIASSIAPTDVRSARAWVVAIATSPLVRQTTVFATPSAGELAPEHDAQVDALLADIRASELFAIARAAIGDRDGHDLHAERAVVIGLVLSRDATQVVGSTLALELDALRRQLDAICADDDAACARSDL